MNTTVWLITFTGKHGATEQVVHTHNALADYKAMYPDAVAQPCDVAAVAELADNLTAALDHSDRVCDAEHGGKRGPEAREHYTKLRAGLARIRGAA